jgi:hypothetical protein
MFAAEVVCQLKSSSLPGLARCAHLNLVNVIWCFFGQIVSRRTPSSLLKPSYCSSNFVLIPLCTDDLTAVDVEMSPFVGWNDLKSDMVKWVIQYGREERATDVSQKGYGCHSAWRDGECLTAEPPLLLLLLQLQPPVAHRALAAWR